MKAKPLRLVFVELKRPSAGPAKADPLQEVVHESLRSQGYKVKIINSISDFRELMK